MRYVDADKELAEMKFAWYPQDMDTTNAIGMYENFLKNAPSADVAPVLHAHWKISYCDSGYRANMICSLCDGFVTADSTDMDGYLFCPCCGAKMDEEVNNG